MITMGATQHAQAVCGVAWLAELDFASGMLRVTTAPRSITTGGNTFTGLGTLAGVANVKESAESSAEQVTLSLAVTDSALLASALGSVEGYRGRAATLYLQLFDEAFQPVGAPVRRWSGVMNKVAVNRKSPGTEAGGGTGSIELLCSRAGMARARNAVGLRLTHAQQQARYPGDTGLRYVRTLVEQPSLWLSKRFQGQ